MAPILFGLAVGTGMVHQVDFLLKRSCPMVQRHMEWDDDFCSTNLGSSTVNFHVGTEEATVKVGASPAKDNVGALRFVALCKLLNMVIYGVIGAYCFKMRVTDMKLKSPTPIPDSPDQMPQDCTLTGGKAMKYDLFSCVQSFDYSCFGMCCFPCFAADLFASNKIKESFWVLWLVIMIPFVVPSTIDYAVPTLGFGSSYGPALLQLFVALFLAKCTGELRQKIGGAPDFFTDVLKWWLCQCCTVVQWQRQMDEIKGDRVTCPMALKDSAKAREVGDAFGVEPLLA